MAEPIPTDANTSHHTTATNASPSHHTSSPKTMSEPTTMASQPLPNPPSGSSSPANRCPSTDASAAAKPETPSSSIPESCSSFSIPDSRPGLDKEPQPMEESDGKANIDEQSKTTEQEEGEGKNNSGKLPGVEKEEEDEQEVASGQPEAEAGEAASDEEFQDVDSENEGGWALNDHEFEERMRAEGEQRAKRAATKLQIAGKYPMYNINARTLQQADLIAAVLDQIPAGHVPLRTCSDALMCGVEALATAFAQIINGDEPCSVHFQKTVKEVYDHVQDILTSPSKDARRIKYITDHTEITEADFLGMADPDVDISEKDFLGEQSIAALLALLFEDWHMPPREHGFALYIVQHERFRNHTTQAFLTHSYGTEEHRIFLRMCVSHWEPYGPSRRAGDESTDGHSLVVDGFLQWAHPLYNGGVTRQHRCGDEADDDVRALYKSRARKPSRHETPEQQVDKLTTNMQAASLKRKATVDQTAAPAARRHKSADIQPSIEEPDDDDDILLDWLNGNDDEHSNIQTHLAAEPHRFIIHGLALTEFDVLQQPDFLLTASVEQQKRTCQLSLSPGEIFLPISALPLTMRIASPSYPAEAAAFRGFARDVFFTNTFVCAGLEPMTEFFRILSQHGQAFGGYYPSLVKRFRIKAENPEIQLLATYEDLVAKVKKNFDQAEVEVEIPVAITKQLKRGGLSQNGHTPKPTWTKQPAKLFAAHEMPPGALR